MILWQSFRNQNEKEGLWALFNMCDFSVKRVKQFEQYRILVIEA